MKLKTLIAAAIASAFALPLAASAGNDTLILAQAGGPAGASATGTGPTGGTPAPRTAGEPKASTGSHGRMGAMGDRSADATGSRSEPNFSMVDKNNDGQISRSEWDAYFRSGSAATGGSTSSPASPSGSVGAPSGSGTTGTTAGPGSASNKTAPSSDTATSPSTSGMGKPQ